MRCFVLTLFSVLPALSLISKADEWSDVHAYARQSFAAEDKHDYASARRDLDAAVQKYPKNALAHWNRGAFFMNRHQYDLALKDFDTAVRLQPVVWLYARWRGTAYAKVGRYDLALADFNRVASFHPSDKFLAELLNERAWIEATCPDARYRNGKQAIQDAQFAVRFGGRDLHASYIDSLAAAYAEIGDFDSAIKYQEQAIAAQKKKDELRGGEERLAEFRQHRPHRTRVGTEPQRTGASG